ncbi:MAG: DNA lyase [Candidatus Hydrothermarchaeales archaeon]
MSYTPTTPLPTSKLHKLDIEVLRNYRERHRDSIIKRLGEFGALKSEGRERIFCELCYCILTPQSTGLICDRAVADLERRGVLRDPISRRMELEEIVKKARFWRKKSRYIIKAWERFVSNEEHDIAYELSARDKEFGDNRKLRNWLRRKMKGMGIGMKEASHFLRNVGYGEGLAILDRHIMGCLNELGVLNEGDMILRSEKDYLRMEECMSDFSSISGLPLEELDLLFWSAKTGYIFK